MVKGAWLVDSTRLNNRRPIDLLVEGVYKCKGFAFGRRGQLGMTNGDKLMGVAKEVWLVVVKWMLFVVG